MGLYSPDDVARIRNTGIRWFATVTTVSEALAAQEAGADAIIAQGMEAGGHRGSFHADDAKTTMVGLFSLLPAVVDAVDRPVIAAGGIGDARGVAAALMLGASAVHIGTAFLRAPEAGIPSAWADAIGIAKPEDTIATRAFSGRLGRSIRSAYAIAAASVDAPKPAPFPVQRNLTRAMRAAAAEANTVETLNTWAGQSGRLARPISAKDIVRELWEGATDLLS